MQKLERAGLLGSSMLVGVGMSIAAAALWAAPGYAQDEPPAPAVEEVTEAEEAPAEDTEKVVVTGSRIRRAEFTSPAPVQVITANFSRDIGLVDPAQILQDSTVAQGQQIDTSFAGFVLDNGPGSSTVDLRGLGASRSLILVNGRRLSPAGVEGAPFAPSANLIPAAAVDRYEILLDGASSVYGSDAVAGVVNVILDTSFDGLELDMFHSAPLDGGGEETNFAAKWGVNSDRGFAGFVAEYGHVDALRRRDRDWSDECTRDIEITEEGEIRDVRLDDWFISFGYQVPTGCTIPRLVNRVSIPILGSIYANPDANVIGAHPDGLYPGFSETNFTPTFPGGFIVPGTGLTPAQILRGRSVPVDSDHDGIADVQIAGNNPNGNKEWLDSEIQPTVDSYSLVSFGEYQTEGYGGATFYYDAFLTQASIDQSTIGSGGGAQLFPLVPATNPYNICNPTGFGVDCGTAYSDFVLSDPYANVFSSIFNGLSPSDVPGQFQSGPIGPQDVQPIVRVAGDRSRFQVDLTQWRFVGGVRGDLELFGPSWTYDLSAVFSRSIGTSMREGVRDDKLNFSLATSRIEGGEVICGDADGLDFDGNVCVPINMFAPSLYQGGEAGDFATQAERDYVWGKRGFATVYEQSIFSGFIGGDLLTLPAGPVSTVIGYEYRVDELKSDPSDIAAQGSLFGFFQDAGASGSKDFHEGFAEVEIPILADLPAVQELNLNVSGRWTEEEFYGAAWTYSVKGEYRPLSWLLLRGTSGTSYRAPNVREQFIAAQSGFNNALFDPCIAPDEAFAGLPPVYDPALDTREQQVLDNCLAAGLDPTTLGISPITGFPSATGTVSAEVIFGGTTGIDPETSESTSLGFVIEQPFIDAFDLTFGATYWNIDIQDSIIEPTSQFIVNDCYVLQPNQTSSFCSRIVRGADGLIDVVNSQPINLNSETAEGIDYNILYEQDFLLAGRAVDVALDVRATNRLTQDVTIIGDNGVGDTDELAGSFGYTNWNGQGTLRVDVDKYRLTWNTRYLEATSQFFEGVDPFNRITTSQTCLGTLNGDDILCRDYAEADSYFRHDASIGYIGDTFQLSVGVRNLFDEDPPRVNDSEVVTNVNAPVGYGYDLLGRRVFVSLTKQF